MKRQIQQTGVRKWYGEDWIKLQDELYKTIETAVLGGMPNLILTGSRVTFNFITGVYTLNEGFVLIDGKVCFVPQTINVTPTVYLTQKVETITTRAYADQNIKPIEEIYTVEVNTATTGGSELKIGWFGMSDNAILFPHFNNQNLTGIPKSDLYTVADSNVLATAKAVNNLNIYLSGLITTNQNDITTLNAVVALHENQIGSINEELYGGGFSSF